MSIVLKDTALRAEKALVEFKEETSLKISNGVVVTDSGVLLVDNLVYDIKISCQELKADGSGYKRIVTHGRYCHKDLSRLLIFISEMSVRLDEPIFEGITRVKGETKTQL
jgi:hypothetical protein